VTYNGQEMTRYDGEQKLRGMERNIRRYKRQALTQEAAGVDNTKARRKIGEWQAAARDFSKQTGIQRDGAREWIGTAAGIQPKGITPQAADYAENLKKAKEIKRLDNARNKVIANTPQGKAMNFQQADGGAPNPNFKKGGGYRTNCQSCVVAYELRRRGFDVETLPNFNGSMLEVLSSDTRLAWVDRETGKPPVYITPAQPTCAKSFDWIKQNVKSNNRYTIEFGWKRSSKGHIIHLYKNDKNILSLYDPQSGTNTLGDEAVLNYIKGVKPSTIQLLDVESCDINMNVANRILQGVKK
jgi:hypothetical protein